MIIYIYALIDPISKRAGVEQRRRNVARTMKKGDLVILPSGRFICLGDHPDGDSMALIRDSIDDALGTANTEDIVKADECEFVWDERKNAWVW